MSAFQGVTEASIKGELYADTLLLGEENLFLLCDAKLTKQDDLARLRDAMAGKQGTGEVKAWDDLRSMHPQIHIVLKKADGSSVKITVAGPAFLYIQDKALVFGEGSVNGRIRRLLKM